MDDSCRATPGLQGSIFGFSDFRTSFRIPSVFPDMECVAPIPASLHGSNVARFVETMYKLPELHSHGTSTSQRNHVKHIFSDTTPLQDHEHINCVNFDELRQYFNASVSG